VKRIVGVKSIILRLRLVLAIAVAVAAGGASAQADPATGISWPDGQALPTFARATHLDTIAVGRLSGDEQLMVGTLQGIVNRRQPRLYLISNGEARTHWLAVLGLPTTEMNDPYALVARYRDELRGMIVFDPEVPGSIDVATTLAGLDDAVVVSPDLAGELTSRFHLSVVEDLRGRFRDDLSAYTWEVDNLWSRTTHRMIVPIAPKQRWFVRDYAVANRAMVFWLRVGVPGERELLDRVLAQMPPNSPYIGWFSPERGSGEVQGVEYLSTHSIYNIAADLFANLTVFSGVPASVASAQPDAPAVPLINRIYVNFIVSDGDNLQYMQNHLKEVWADPARGRVPISWTINPLAADAAPAMLSYYERTATPNDYFVTGSSGAGYIHPSAWPDATFHLFAEQTQRYMARTGLRVIQIQNTGAARPQPLEPQKAAAYASGILPLGINMMNNVAPTISVVAGGVPVASKASIKSADDAHDVIARLSAGWDGRTPRFLTLFVDAWTLTPSDVAAIAEALPGQYQVVRTDQFFSLVRQAMHLPPS